MRYFSLFLLLSLLLPPFRPAAAQGLALSGQVVEAVSGEPVPFASVFVPGTSQGVTADLEGKFRLAIAGVADSIGVSALGFASQRRKLGPEPVQTVLFRLRAGGVALAEVVVSSRQPENPANRHLLPPTDGDGRPLPRLRSLGSQPYAEVSYGIENIFKLVRVDFIHRLTYRNLANNRNFGIRAGLQFRL